MQDAAVVGTRRSAPWITGGSLLLLVLALYSPLLRPNAIETRDHVDHYLRVEQYAGELAAGRWPQLLPDPVRGGGHAFPRYYPPISHLAAVPLYVVTGNAILATHATAVLSLLLATLAMFSLLRMVGAPEVGAALGALAYGTMPYQFTLLHVRGAFAESLAMLWYPLILMGGWRLATNGRLPRWWPLVLTALFLTHTTIALWALPAITLVALLALGARQAGRMARPVFFGMVLALGIAVCYLAPMRTGLPGVRAGNATLMLATAEDLARRTDGLVAALPLALLAAGMGFGGLVALWKLWKLGPGGDLTMRLLAASLVGMAGVVGFMLAPGGVWKLVPQPFLYIQFPWRLTGLLVLFASLAMGLVAVRFRSVTGRRVLVVCIAVLTFAAVPRAVGPARGVPVLPQERVSQLLHSPYADLGLTYNGDYLPRGVEPRELARSIARTRVELLNAAGPAGWQRTRQGATTTIPVREAAQVALPLTGYTDLWTVRDIESGEVVATANVGGQLAVALEAGRHRLEITPRLPWPTRIGLTVALAALITLVLAPAAWFRAPSG